MKRRTLLAATATAPLAAIGRAAAQTSKIPVVWWHAMTGANAEEINRLARAFNDAQSEAEVQPIFKGGYADTLTAAIAAWRADQAPHLVQIFEVGTGSMLAAGPATKQVWQKKPAWTLIPPSISPACVAITACRMGDWHQGRSILRRR
jgi:sn-glycerol 3-phosphate transport system substrate-binding protein